MGRTKDLLRDNIPFSPGHFGSIEEFAAAIGWDLSTKEPSRSSINAGCVMQEHHYQALVASVVYVVEAAIHFEDDQQAIENHVDRVLSCYIRKVKPW